MKYRPLAIFLTLLLAVAYIVPSAFLIAPQKVYAQYAVDIVGDTSNDVPFFTKTTFETTFSAIKSALIEAHTFTTQLATYASYVNTYVLQPLAFVLAVKSMKSITVGVLAFVTGQANGTGAPQFVQNLQKNLQGVGDTQALAFFAQFGKNSNSPFAASIASSLRTNYLQNTSAAGFWAANICTLTGASPNVGAFLAGNWSQGGVKAWLTLTTQSQNNPYTLYQASQAQLASLVGSAQATRSSTIANGQGFLSWCGTSSATQQAAVAASTAATNAAAAVPQKIECPASGGFVDAGGDCYASAADAAAADAAGNAAETFGAQAAGLTAKGGVGVNPGDPCTNSDGTPGTIQTPGSTIKATLDKVLGGTQDKLAQMGSLANEVTGIMGDLTKVFATVNLATQILGGFNSGGLAAAGQASASSPSLLSQYGASSLLGVSTSTVLQGAAANPLLSSGDMPTRVAAYQLAWNTISDIANAARNSLISLSNSCSATNPGEAADAQTALTLEVNPLLARVVTANMAIASATAMVAKVQTELTSGDAAYATDLQALQTMTPTDDDVANIQQETQSSGGMTSASPAGSLIVLGGSIVDQMGLISANAQALQSSVCGVTAGGGLTPCSSSGTTCSDSSGNIGECLSTPPTGGLFCNV